MSELLKSLNKAGLVEKLDGDDERFAKIESAAKNVAEKFKESPPFMIRAVLAGLDPDIPSDDPVIMMAADALVDVWTSVRSIHIDPPVFLYRTILLDACNHVAEGLNAVILTHTAADTLTTVRLGREKGIVLEMLERWARLSEEYSLTVPTISDIKRAPVTKKIELAAFVTVSSKKTDREKLLPSIAMASGQNYKGNSLGEHNPYWPHQHPQQWAGEFSDRLTKVLANQIDFVLSGTAQSCNEIIKQIGPREQTVLDSVKDLLSSQRSWLQEVVKQSEEQRKADHLRLNTLWWCEALYSSSLKCSYRELPLVLAGAVMPFDLLEEVQTPTPASVTYALSETVAKLPDAEVVKSYKIHELLNTIIENSSILPEEWAHELESPPKSGRLSIRDMVVAALQGEKDIQKLLQQANLGPDFTISLPRLSQAIYRQEQAVRLAGAGQ